MGWLDPELRRDQELVTTCARKAPKFALCDSEPIHACDIEVPDALVERFGQEPLPVSAGAGLHQPRTAEANSPASQALNFLRLPNARAESG
ncbi:MAG TPA: hypothetical protein VN892_00385 [Solirubrobacteraceae bacterium]|nr:hypothetical protein [Solirubrobacteraceae bacterium]